MNDYPGRGVWTVEAYVPSAPIRVVDIVHDYDRLTEIQKAMDVRHTYQQYQFERLEAALALMKERLR